MADKIFIGIDIGTTGTRAAAFDEKGTQRGYCYREYPLFTDPSGMAELDPETIFGTFLQVTRDCIRENRIEKNQVEGVGLSSQMHSLVGVGKDGACLTRAMTWADTRPAQESLLLSREHDCRAIYRKTGCRVQHPAYYPAKLLWLKRCKPEVFEKAEKFVTIKEYILYRLYGGYVLDLSDASTTGCFNIHTFQWDEEILRDVLNLGSKKFGEVVDCTHTLTKMKRECAEQMGLEESVPMAVGSSDGIMANLGCGGTDSTTMSCTVGTSGALRIAVDHPLLDERARTWCYCFTRNQWVAGGAVNDGGIVLRWFRDHSKGTLEQELAEYGVKDEYQLFDRYAEQIKPGSDGLIFLPYLMGERSPGWHADASAFFCGLRYTHDTRHMLRAAMEGVLYNLYAVFEVLSGGAAGSGAERIVANGGYVHSDTWMQMQADIFGRELVVSNVGEAAAWGAAFTAMVAVGAASGFDRITQRCGAGRVFRPNVANHEIYQECYRRFREYYGLLIDRERAI